MNSVELIGRLTRDPEVRYTSEGQMAVATFKIAIDRPPDKSGLQQADFPRITVFGKQAETCEKYLKKGKPVAIQGRIQTGSYTNKNGDTVYTTDVVANRVEFLPADNTAQRQEPPRQEEAQAEPPQEAQQVIGGFEEIDEDVPF